MVSWIELWQYGGVWMNLSAINAIKPVKCGEICQLQGVVVMFNFMVRHNYCMVQYGDVW
jgi:hypothetical protein